MVRALTRPVISHLTDYARASRSFSNNARLHIASAFLQSLGGSMIGCVFGLFVTSSGMSASTVGYVEGSIGLATAVVALIGPLLVASFGYRSLMLGSLVLLAAARFSSGLMPAAVALVALGVVIGIGDGFLKTVNAAFLSQNSGHEERTQLFSAEFLARMLAVFVGGIAGGLLPSFVGGPASVGYQWAIWVGATIMAVGVVPMLFVREEVHGVHGFWRVSIESARQFEAWTHLCRIVTPQAFLVAAGAMTAPFVPLYLNKTLGASVQQVGLIQGFGALFVGMAAFATPWITRRFGVGRGVTMLQALALPLIAAVPFVGGLLFGVVVLFLRSTLMGAGGPLYNEFSMERVRAQDKPLVGGGLIFALSVAGFIGNVIGGRLMEVSYTAPYLPAAALYALGTAVTYFMWVHRPKVHMQRAESAGDLALELA